MDKQSRLIRPRYVVSDIDRHGNKRWYYRRPGQPKVRLPDSGPGAKEFIEAYRDAFNGAPEAIKRKPSKRNLDDHWIQGGYVYFLRAGSVVKIGFSKNPIGRWSELRTGMSEPVSAIVAIVGTTVDERALHRRLSDHHLRGEWFKATDEVVAMMAEVARLGVKALRPTDKKWGISAESSNVVSIA